MLENKKIEYIPAKPPKREQRVGIYARVSTSSAEQLQSLTAQVSHLTRVTAANKKWLLVDVYIWTLNQAKLVSHGKSSNGCCRSAKRIIFITFPSEFILEPEFEIL